MVLATHAALVGWASIVAEDACSLRLCAADGVVERSASAWPRGGGPFGQRLVIGFDVVRIGGGLVVRSAGGDADEACKREEETPTENGSLHLFFRAQCVCVPGTNRQGSVSSSVSEKTPLGVEADVVMR